MDELDISPTSERLGMSLKVWRHPDIEPFLEPPGWQDTIGATSNHIAALLMMGTNDELGPCSAALDTVRHRKRVRRARRPQGSGP